MKTSVLTVLLSTLLPAAASAFSERLVVPLTDPGRPVVVQADLIAGSITVEAYEGQEIIVEVSVRKMNSLDDADDSDDSGAVREDGLRRLQSEAGVGFSVEESENQVRLSADSWKRPVDFSLQVPARTTVVLKTVNHGEIKVRGVTGEHELSNVNGPIEARAMKGSVVANSTNGDVVVELLEVTPGKPMAFSTMNGDVDVTFPANLKADLRMRSQTGDILTDFEVTTTRTQPRVERDADGGRYRVRMESETWGTIGGGGPEISFRTFHGDILIRKRKG